LGVITDGVFVNGGQFELTTTWTAGRGLGALLLANFSTAVYGTYTQVRYDDAIISSNLFCTGQNIIQLAVAGAILASTTGPWAL